MSDVVAEVVTAAAPALAAEGLVVRGPDGAALAGPVSLALARDACLTVLGETGTGKSLLAQALLGALPEGLAAEGRVRLDGRPIDAPSPRARRALWRRRVAMLPQEPWRAPDPTMAALAQVAETHRHVAGLGSPAARSRAAWRSAWPSRPRARAARRCCWPTSPPRGSTPPCATRWGRSSRAPWPRGAPF